MSFVLEVFGLIAGLSQFIAVLLFLTLVAYAVIVIVQLAEYVIGQSRAEEKKVQLQSKYNSYYAALEKNNDWSYDFLEGFSVSEEHRHLLDEHKNKKIVRSGFAFEFFMHDLLIDLGFKNVIVTKKEAWGDYGADVICDYGWRKCVFQCKHYPNKNVGIDDALNLLTAKYYYRADAVFLVSASEFSAHAKTLAKKERFNLIGYGTLGKIISGEYNFNKTKGLSFIHRVLAPPSLNRYYLTRPHVNETKREEAIKENHREAYKQALVELAEKKNS